MKKALFITLAVAGAISLLLFGGVACFVLTFDLFGPPHDEVLEELPSPDGFYTARLFERNAGATTAYSYHIELKSEGWPTEKIFIGRYVDEADIEWENERTLLVASKNQVLRKDIFLQIIRKGDVEIRYSPGLMP